MPELKPTLATAAVNANGVVFDVYGLQGTPDPVEHVPCLILPAPRPIEQCPEEWKDGRWVLAHISNPLYKRWVDAKWDVDFEWWIGSSGGVIHDCDITHIILPPPAPQEAQDAR